MTFNHKQPPPQKKKFAFYKFDMNLMKEQKLLKTILTKMDFFQAL